MTNPPRRRRTDRPSPAPATPDTSAAAAAAHAAAWVQRCALRIVEIEPQIPAEEATQIARTMFGAERTAVMDPAAAADFVADQMRQASRPRFERRTA